MPVVGFNKIFYASKRLGVSRDQHDNNLKNEKRFSISVNFQQNLTFFKHQAKYLILDLLMWKLRKLRVSFEECKKISQI